RDAGVDAALLPVLGAERLGHALALVVAGARADAVDEPPIALGLRVHARVAVDLAGAGLQQARAPLLGQAQAVQGAVEAGEGGEDRIALVVRRARRAGEVPDPVEAPELG